MRGANYVIAQGW